MTSVLIFLLTCKLNFQITLEDFDWHIIADRSDGVQLNATRNKVIKCQVSSLVKATLSIFHLNAFFYL